MKVINTRLNVGLMKQQLPDSEKLNKKNRKNKWYLLILLLFIFPVFFVSCENDIEKIKSYTDEGLHPTVYGKNYEIFRSDSGILQIRIKAQKILHFGDIDEPYIEFPEGILVYFYDSDQEIESKIRANYAIYYELQKLWMAKNNVEATNIKNDEQLNTEELFWDEGNNLIYSDKFTKITNVEGTFFGNNGFESNQNFSKWKLKGTKGTINIKDE